MDIIFIHEFKIDTLIGIYDWEKKVPQTIQLDLEIGIPDNRAAKSNDVKDTIDYGRVVARVQETLASRHFLLLEAMAEDLAATIQKEFGAPWIRISVAKLALFKGVKRLGVTIERGNRS